MFKDVIASIDNPNHKPYLSKVLTEANVNFEFINVMIDLGLINKTYEMRMRSKPKVILHVRRLGIDFISAYHTLENIAKAPHI